MKTNSKKMKKINFLPLLILFFIASCQSENDKVIGKKELKLESDLLSPEVLWSFGRLSDAQVSPDGKMILYGVSYYDVPENKGNRDLFLVPVDGGKPIQLTKTPYGEYSAVWRPDGQKIAYLSYETGKGEIYEINIDGSSKKKISFEEGSISNFLYAPSMDKVLFTMDVKVLKAVSDIHPDLPKANGLLINDLIYRHWDQWEDEFYSHLFVAEYKKNSAILNSKDIMEGEPYDTPLKPFGGIEEITWSPDGKTIAYTCKKLYGKDYALSTNSDIYLYDIVSGETKNLTEGMLGYDRYPSFSNDGKKMLWTSMERAGFEADKERLFVYDFESKTKKQYLCDWQYSPSGITWTPDDQSIYFVVGIDATHQIYNFNFNDQKLRPITKGLHDYHSVALAENVLVGSKVSMVMPEEIYRIQPETGEETQLTFENKEILDQLNMPEVRKTFVKTTDGKDMLTWVILPPNFDENKKYPTILYCEGGPQSPLSQFWSYRWNFSIMASQGYVIVAPNRRGTTALGQDWTDQISKDNTGQPMRDLLSAIDQLKTEPYIDENRLGAIGASFGGFSVNWLAGNHEGRFKAFISHCGVFHSEMEFLTTEENFFDYWEKGGAPWEKDNKIAQKSFANSPHQFVDKWDTPILIVHGGLDFRVPVSQGMAAFNAAQLRGIPSQFLYFPTENHWVLSPQNGILWQRTFFNWLDRWLKD